MGFPGEVSFQLFFSILPLQNAKGNVQATKIIDMGAADNESGTPTVEVYITVIGFAVRV